VVTEVDLFAAQLTATLRASRHHDLLICDKTIVNVLAYARMVLTKVAHCPAKVIGRDCHAHAPG
jgi:hypothetical protein